jgi:hypothetical protein
MSDLNANSESLGTKNVKLFKSCLTEVNGKLTQVHPPIAQLVVIVTKLDGYMAEGVTFAGYVEDLLRVLKAALQMCKYLGELIPEVGPILADAASFIERLNIEDKVRKVVHEIKSILKKVAQF